MPYTPADFVGHFIDTWEGKLSLDPADQGNYYLGNLIGSNFGVTGAALAEYRGTKVITARDIATLTRSEAIKVGLKLVYDKSNFDDLPWDPVVASALDAGWGSGPGQAIKLLQRMIAVGDDGSIGRFTVAAYQDYVKAHGLEAAAKVWCQARYDFYDLIIKVRPTNAKYRNGWRNRAASFLPGTPFWKAWSL